MREHETDEDAKHLELAVAAEKLLSSVDDPSDRRKLVRLVQLAEWAYCGSSRAEIAEVLRAAGILGSGRFAALAAQHGKRKAVRLLAEKRASEFADEYVSLIEWLVEWLETRRQQRSTD